jgi:hypothetical protein
MELTGRTPHSASRANAGLGGTATIPQALKACIAGCESHRTAPATTHFAVVVAVRGGPGRCARSRDRAAADVNVQPVQSYTIQFDGQGGAAGFGKGSAEVALVGRWLARRGCATRRARRRWAARSRRSARVWWTPPAAKIGEDFSQAFRDAPARGGGPLPKLPPPHPTAPGRAPDRRLLWLAAGVLIVVVLAPWPAARLRLSLSHSEETAMDSLDLQVLQQARDWRAQGHDAWLVTVIETWGSAPRPPGALLALRDDGLVVGSVSGGCVEDDLIDRARHGRARGAAEPWSRTA